MKVSVVIVNYKTGEMLRECLRSLERHVTVPFEVVVVDNASADAALDELTETPRLRIIRNPENLGFAKACNLGARAATGTRLHFLNPDTEVTPSLNGLYARAMSNTERVIYVTRILNANRQPEKTYHALPTLKNVVRMIFRTGEIAKWYLGASFLLDPELYWSLGGLSEDYFVYGEDVDFFYKAHLARVPVVQSEAEVVHLSGGASQKVWSPKQRLERVERGAMIFTSKFGLRFDYFVFKHVAFLRQVWRNPAWSLLVLRIYWKELLLSFWRTPEPRWNVQ